MCVDFFGYVWRSVFATDAGNIEGLLYSPHGITELKDADGDHCEPVPGAIRSLCIINDLVLNHEYKVC